MRWVLATVVVLVVYAVGKIRGYNVGADQAIGDLSAAAIRIKQHSVFVRIVGECARMKP